MRSEKEIRELLEKLKSYINMDVFDEWFCADCGKQAEERCYLEEHTLIHESIEHYGAFEWYRCLKWVLEEKVPDYLDDV